MEKIREFFKKYYLNEILLLLGVSLFMLLLFYGKSESFLVDVGREAYLPWQVMNGEVLYKDIFNVYGPLSYQLNAIMYQIFGVKLSTLYIAGYINAFLILILTFFITKIFTGRKLALLTSFMVMGSCLFIKTFFNFVFPYSYAAVYALSGYLLSILAFLFYIKKNKNIFLYIAFLTAGYSFANKIEYLPYFALLFLTLGVMWLIYKRIHLKEIMICCVSFFAIPFLSFLVLIIQGAGLHDFYNAFLQIEGLLETPASKYFYKSYGLFWNQENFIFSMDVLKHSVLVLVPVSLLFYGLNYLNYRFLNSKILKIIFGFGSAVFCCFVAYHVFKYFQMLDNKFFCWLGIVSIALLIGVCIYVLLRLFKKTKISKKDFMFFFLLISAVSVSLKGISGITTECYGTFTIAALIIPFVVFVSRYIPKLIKILNKKVYYETVCSICFIIVILFFALNIKKLADNKLYPVRTERGIIFVPEYLKNMSHIVNYINTKTEKDDVVVSMPEGAMINFLTGRKSHNKYYYLIPVNTQIFGVENILSDFRKNPPDYFIINNIPYTPFNVSHICSYAKPICDYIEENYELKLYTTSELEFYIYKLKK